MVAPECVERVTPGGNGTGHRHDRMITHELPGRANRARAAYDGLVLVADPPPVCRMRRGTTLPEMTVVLVVAGILAAVSFPTGWQIRNRLMVEHQTAVVASAYREARLAAMEMGTPAVLWIQPDLLSVWQSIGPDSVLLWQRAGPAREGVVLESTVDRVVIAPSGMAMGVANGRITLRRGAVSRGWVVSRLGRLRLDRRPP